MRKWKLVSGVGVAIVAAWLAVTNLAYAGEFTCSVGWLGDTDCGLPTFTLRTGESLKIEVDSIQNDGKDVGDPATFTVQDAKKNKAIRTLVVAARTSASWKYEGQVSPLDVRLRVNHPAMETIVVRGRYTITK